MSTGDLRARFARVAAVVVLVVGGPLLFELRLGGVAAQDRPGADGDKPDERPKPGDRKTASFAPRWKKGDRWLVRTFQKDRTAEITGIPQKPPGPRLPGYPPLRDGVPVGWKHANRWKLEVVRIESVRPEGAPGGDYHVVSLEAQEGKDPRRAELWFGTRSAALAKLVVSPGKPDEKATWLKGNVHLDLPEARDLVFPLEWPDLVAAATLPKLEVKVDGRARRVQTVLAPKEGASPEEWRVGLGEIVEKETVERVVLTWKRDGLFWTRLEGPELAGELLEETRAD